MAQTRVAFKQPVPRGAVVVSGTSSSGLCQDPNGCIVETADTVPTYTPQPYDSTVAEVVLPDTPQPQQSEVPMASRPLPADTAAMMGIQRPQQPAGPQCNPGDPYSACATRPAQGYSRQIMGLPTLQTNFQATPGEDPTSAGLRAAGASYLMRLAGMDPNEMRATTVASAAGMAAGRARELAAQGVPFDAAQAIAQREWLDQQGLQAIGQTSGATAAQTKAITSAARLAAEQDFLRGVGPSQATRRLGEAAPGMYVVGPNGQVYMTTPGGMQQQGVAPEAARNPFTAAALLSGRPGLPLARAQQAETTSAALAKARTQAELQNTGRLGVAAFNAQARAAAAAAKPSRDDPEVTAAAQADYNARSPAYKLKYPFSVHLKAYKEALAESNKTDLALDDTAVDY